MPPAPPSAPNEPLPLRQKIALIQAWAKFPALTLMVFLRSGLGYRLVNPLALGGTALFMVLIFGVSDERNRPDDLLLFVIAVMTLGLYQRYNRWLLLREGQRHHSFYIGTSILEPLPLPGFFYEQRRVERFLDPLLGLLMGFLLLDASPILSRWILFSSLCLAVFEDSVYRRELTRLLDTLDGLTLSEVQGEIVEQFSPPAESVRVKAAGVPTGLGTDIEERIHHRSKKP